MSAPSVEKTNTEKKKVVKIGSPLPPFVCGLSLASIFYVFFASASDRSPGEHLMEYGILLYIAVMFGIAMLWLYLNLNKVMSAIQERNEPSEN